MWNSWWDIRTGTQIGMAVSGLPWTDMSRWCEDNGVFGEDRLRWVRLLRAMDETSLAHYSKR